MKKTIKKKKILFKFPADKVLREKWIRAVPQKNSKITCNSKVLSRNYHNFFVSETN